MNSFLNKGFKFAILKGSRKLPNLIERLQSSLIGFDKTREPSFRKRPERSSIPAALRTFVLLNIFFYFDLSSICQMESNNLNKMSIILYYIVKSIFVARGWELFQKIVS